LEGVAICSEGTPYLLSFWCWISRPTNLNAIWSMMVLW
jgi:hypothetical protein